MKKARPATTIATKTDDRHAVSSVTTRRARCGGDHEEPDGDDGQANEQHGPEALLGEREEEVARASESQASAEMIDEDEQPESDREQLDDRRGERRPLPRVEIGSNATSPNP